MRSSPSRMIRPRSFWGSAVAGLALTFVVPASAEDTAPPAPAGKPAATAPTKPGPGEPGAKERKGPPGLKGAMEARKEKLAGGDGEPRGKTEAGQGRPDKGHPGKGPHGKPGKAAKARVAPSPKVAMGRYGSAVSELRQAEAAAAAASPGEADKARKDLQAAQRAVRRAEKDIRAAHRADAMKMLNMNPEERKKLDMQLQVRAKKLATDRKDRAQKRQNELQKELGEKVKLAPVRAELQRHAWRVARLERLTAIAEAAGRTEAATRAKELLAKEMADHPARLKKAAEGGKGSAAANKTAPVGAAPTKAVSSPPVPNKPAAVPTKEAAQ